MPHQCTNCDRQFPDGSKEMLSGCPGCGGNKFQFLPSSAVDDDALSGTGDDEPTDAAGDMQFGLATGGDEDGTAGGVDTTDAGGPGPARADDEIIDADARGPPLPEDSAQADARSTVISDDELPDATEVATDAVEEADDSPDLSALRAELNDQFESIKILEPGQYELNLMELYDRQEYIIALEEDGRYAIEVPDTWREDGE